MDSTTTTKNKIKNILVGDGGVGKTSYVNRIRTGNFSQKYIPTMGVEVHPLNIPTIKDTVYSVWDCAGQEKFGGLQEEYWKYASGAIVMFDMTSKTTYKNSKWWCEKIEKECPGITIVVCGNKVESNQKVKMGKITNKYKHFNISVKNKYNLFKPFEYLNDLDKALEFGQKAEAVPMTMKYHKAYSDLYSTLSELHNKLGNNDKALQYLYIYQEKLSVSLDIAQQKQLASAQIDHNVYGQYRIRDKLAKEKQQAAKNNNDAFSNSLAYIHKFEQGRILFFLQIMCIFLLGASILYIRHIQIVETEKNRHDPLTKLFKIDNSQTNDGGDMLAISQNSIYIIHTNIL